MARIGLRNAGLAAGLLLLAGPAMAEFEAPSAPGGIGPSEFRPSLAGATLRLFAGHDSNVFLVPDRPPFFTGETDSPFVGATLEAYVVKPIGAGTLFGATLRADRTAHTSDPNNGLMGSTDKPSDYDLTVLNPSLFVERRGEVSGREVALRAAYDYRMEDGEVAAIGLDAHRVTVSLRTNLKSRLGASVSYAIAWEEFEVEFPAPALDARDSTHETVSAELTYRFPSLKRSLAVQLAWNDNDADGSNFDYDGYTIGAVFDTHLVDRLYAQAGVSYQDRDYEGFTSGFITAPGRTEQQVLTASAKLMMVLSRHITLDLTYDYSDYDANQPQFSGDRSVTTLGASLTF
ncbi:MAG: outer membrane beta-barrel protein [Alphaproteobacteria bacterium]|nr:outer membrane beta-barrel protein [Alphaproteobacteria bacterium]